MLINEIPISLWHVSAKNAILKTGACVFYSLLFASRVFISLLLVGGLRTHTIERNST